MFAKKIYRRFCKNKVIEDFAIFSNRFCKKNYRHLNFAKTNLLKIFEKKVDRRFYQKKFNRNLYLQKKKIEITNDKKNLFFLQNLL